PFKTLCFLNYALMIRQDYDITSSLRRGALQSSGDIINLIGDKDPTDEDGDTEVSVSLGKISSKGKKSWESDIGDCNNTGDGGAEVELLEPGFEFDDQEWVEIGTFSFVTTLVLQVSLDYCSWDFLGPLRIFLEQRIASIKGYRGGSGG
nr:hypothetical protein [Tanacetum cinerariifolium]